MLRTEKGYLHIGTDTDGTTLPQDVGTGARHRQESGELRRAALAVAAGGAATPRGPQLVGLASADGRTLLAVGAQIAPRPAPTLSEGRVTSSCWSPALGRPVALALLNGGAGRLGERVRVHHLGRTTEAEVVKTTVCRPAGSAPAWLTARRISPRRSPADRCPISPCGSMRRARWRPCATSQPTGHSPRRCGRCSVRRSRERRRRSMRRACCSRGAARPRLSLLGADAAGLAPRLADAPDGCCIDLTGGMQVLRVAGARSAGIPVPARRHRRGAARRRSHAAGACATCRCSSSGCPGLRPRPRRHSWSSASTRRTSSGWIRETLADLD